MSEKREEPAWLAGAVRIWVEDDSPGARHTDGHETIATAWRRIFGEEIPVSGGEQFCERSDLGVAYFCKHDKAIKCSADDIASIWLNREQFARLPECALREIGKYALDDCREAWGPK
jgi:hypothetical protein